MRIVGGKFRGKLLATPKDDRIRPTTDRVRESIFNILAHGEFAKDGMGLPMGAKVLDLFAGTGALGLEAYSRGAVSVTFVDDHPESRALIRRNIEAMGATGATRLMRRDALDVGPVPPGNQAGGPFDLIFLDPPYGKDWVGKAIANAHKGGWFNAGAVIVAEMEITATAPEIADLTLVQTRDYGDSRIAFYRVGTSS
jgi:16S rRNA (guanine966-N2)-methyltransferase